MIFYHPSSSTAPIAVSPEDNMNTARCLNLSLVAGLCAALFCISSAFAREQSSIIIDAATGRVVQQDDPDGIRHPASLTKIMTLYLTFDALDAGRLKLTDRMPVSAHASSMTPTKLGVRAGSSLMVEHAILSLVTQSANDAAVVLAEALGGTESGFAELMTRTARRLGMSRTVFQNASGLPDPDQVTSARDMAALSLALLRDHPDRYRYFSTRVFKWGGSTLRNHNHLMERYRGMDGIKTGYVQASGFNLAASAVRGGRRLVGVVMGGASAPARDAKMEDLLDDAFATLRREDPGVAVAMADEGEKAPQPTRAAKAEPRSKKATPPATTTSRKAKSEARKPPTRVAGAKPALKREEDEWGVQLGTYSSKSVGEKVLDRASRKLPDHVSDATATVVAASTGGTKIYRARLMGMNEKEARALCSKLKNSGEKCVPVAPAGG